MRGSIGDTQGRLEVRTHQLANGMKEVVCVCAYDKIDPNCVHPSSSEVPTQLKSPEEVIKRLRQELADAHKALVYGFYEDTTPIYVQGDKAMELCEIVTAEEMNRLVNENVILTPGEAKLIYDVIKRHQYSKMTERAVSKLKRGADKVVAGV